jgi:hypothetical protein
MDQIVGQEEDPAKNKKPYGLLRKIQLETKKLTSSGLLRKIQLE